jgi:hypothetical protein
MKVHELNVHEGCAKKCNVMNTTLLKATRTNPILSMTFLQEEHPTIMGEYFFMHDTSPQLIK